MDFAKATLRSKAKTTDKSPEGEVTYHDAIEAVEIAFLEGLARCEQQAKKDLHLKMTELWT